MESLSRDTLCNRPLPFSGARRRSRFPATELATSRRKNENWVVCGHAQAQPAFGFSCTSYSFISEAVKLFWQQERKTGAVAFAAVTVGVVSLSLAQPALAETIHTTLGMDDVTATLTAGEISELGAELHKVRLSQRSTPVGDISVREQLGNKAGQDDGRTKKRVTGEAAGERQALAVLVPASGPLPTNLVAAAAVGSVASAVSKNSQHVGLLARLLQHLGGGGFAGAIGATIVYPLDTVKTRLQAQSEVNILIIGYNTYQL